MLDPKKITLINHFSSSSHLKRVKIDSDKNGTTDKHDNKAIPDDTQLGNTDKYGVTEKSNGKSPVQFSLHRRYYQTCWETDPNFKGLYLLFT